MIYIYNKIKIRCLKRLKMDNNNSSSEDEFMTEALKEATDQHFLKESFFKTKQERSSEDEKNIEKLTESGDQKSLRPNLQHKDEPNIFGVSNAFQNFITKSLSKKLDKSIKFVEMENDISTPDDQGLICGGGIRFLSTFNTVVCDLEENSIANSNFSRSKKRRKPRLLKEDDSVPCKIKIKEASVNPEWVLSKCDTKAWANRRKEAEFKYKKLLDGTLVEQ